MNPKDLSDTKFRTPNNTVPYQLFPWWAYRANGFGFEGVAYFAESFHRHLLIGGAFLPKTPLVDIAALGALLRFRVLRSQTLNVTSDLPKEDTYAFPWKARLQFIEKAIPVAAVSLFSRMAPSLERQITLAMTRLPALSAIREDILDAKKGVEGLSPVKLTELLTSVRDALGRTTPLPAAEKLREALAEAEAELTAAVGELETMVYLSCFSLAKFQYKGSGLVPRLNSSADVLEFCKEQTAKPKSLLQRRYRGARAGVLKETAGQP